MTSTLEDAAVVLQWAIWDVRTGDMPSAVKAAAHRLSSTGGFPRPARSGGYAEGRVWVTAFPACESDPMPRRAVTRPFVAAVVDEMLTDDTAYILIQPDD